MKYDFLGDPMPQNLTLSDATFEKLQRLAVAFVDTPETVITRLADEELKRRGDQSSSKERGSAGEILRLDPDRHESLTHAKLIEATVNGQPLHRPKWNNLLDNLHVAARQRLGSFDAVQNITGAHIKDGKYEQDGFHFLPDADFSLQGVDANLAWDHSLSLARHLRIPIHVRFEWRDKDGAARRGETAILEWSPANLAIA
jgi:hypothetical protein